MVGRYCCFRDVAFCELIYETTGSEKIIQPAAYFEISVSPREFLSVRILFAPGVN